MLFDSLDKALTKRGLSPKEKEITELVARGRSNSEISIQLAITPKMVKNYLGIIYAMLNVKSRAQLIVFCLPHMSYIGAEK